MNIDKFTVELDTPPPSSTPSDEWIKHLSTWHKEAQANYTPVDCLLITVVTTAKFNRRNRRMQKKMEKFLERREVLLKNIMPIDFNGISVGLHEMDPSQKSIDLSVTFKYDEALKVDPSCDEAK